MHPDFVRRPFWAILLGVQLAFVGCTRTQYRMEADQDAYCAIAQKNGDKRWQARNFTIELDPRSRYFDKYSPDCSPMPKDDPAAHRYMQQVNGMQGWEHWHDNGVRPELENPNWKVQLANYVNLTDDGAVRLNIESALKLAYVHSPDHQTQRETLYLAALDVVEERFSLDTQIFGGYDLDYRHQGRLQPAGIGFNGNTSQYSVNGPSDRNESNRVTLGRPNGGNPALQLSRQFATAGTLLAGFANSFVVEFKGPEATLSSSLLNFSVVQPLLAGGGRDIALEQLTFFERSLLSNLRAYSQFRQGFYTQVVIGERGVQGPRGAFRSTDLQVFSGQAGLGGYVGLLQQLQQIRNSEDNLSLQLRTLAQLEALLDVGVIDLVQVDQFRQNVERERASLLRQRNNYQNSLDQYRTGTLGLPPNLPIELDDQLIRQFQLVGRDATKVQDEISELQDRVGTLPKNASAEDIRRVQEDVIRLMKPIREQLDLAKTDIERVSKSIGKRTESMDAEQKDSIVDVIELLDSQMVDLEQQYVSLEAQADAIEKGDFYQASDRAANASPAPKDPLELEGSEKPIADFSDAENDDSNTEDPPGDDSKSNGGHDSESDESKEAPGDLSLPDLDLQSTDADDSDAEESQDDRGKRATVVLLRQMLRLMQGAILVQARSRLESVSIEAIDLDSEEAFQIALSNRLDFMNGRTALVDTWRLIQVNADALQSVLNFIASGDVRTAKNNPVNFRGSTGTAQLGVQFDAPFTRLIERNSYRASLINYQQDRRNYIQSRDALHQGLRVLLRELDQLRLNLEIQRRAVAIAIRRVDFTREKLYAPAPMAPSGRRSASVGPTAAINLLSAQSALRDTQDAFLSVWLNYYAAKMRLSRELGIMMLDENGRWIETPPPSSADDKFNGLIETDNTDQLKTELPPELSEKLIETVDALPDDFEFEAPADGPPTSPDVKSLQADAALLE